MLSRGLNFRKRYEKLDTFYRSFTTASPLISLITFNGMVKSNRIASPSYILFI